MRHWLPPQAPAAAAVLTDLVGDLGLPGFERRLLARLRELTPAASCSVYRTGSRPALFLSGALDVPDTTRQCWQAYLSGPWRNDRSLYPAVEAAPATAAAVCHITASEVPAEHRSRIYEAHGVAERVSVVQRDAGDALFAVNFYRHATQPAFTDAQLDSFGAVAAAVLALTRKHLALSQADTPRAPDTRLRLQQLCPALTGRELDVCERLLRGLTQEGAAADLGLALPTVKTYRNRAFSRLGIHFRSELTAMLLRPVD